MKTCTVNAAESQRKISSTERASVAVVPTCTSLPQAPAWGHLQPNQVRALNATSACMLRAP